MELAEKIITLLVGVAVFITGMNMMSAGLKKATGKSLKNFFKKTQNNSFIGLGIGAGVTALIQSSAATCVIVVGFINAGVMSLAQGISVMMGSYIGTTITGVLVSLSSFNISMFLIAFAFIGVVMMFFKNEKVKNIGQILCGLGLLFFGLGTVSDVFKNSAEINSFCNYLFSVVNFPLLLLLIGIVVTALMQSSSATIGIVIVMVGSGVVPFSSALYIALGATIGTCITTLIATIGGTVGAKRAGFISLIIKVVSGLAATLIIWPLEGPISWFFENCFGSAEFGLAVFLIIFNLLFMGLFLPLIKPLEKLSIRLIKDKDEENKKKQLLYIDDKLLSIPDLAISQTKKEIIHMYELSMENFALGYHYLVLGEKEKADTIAEREDNIDYINNALSKYLISLSNKVDNENSKIVGSYFHVINDIERIGDHAYNFYENAKEMQENDLHFSDQAKEDLQGLFDLVMRMSALTEDIFTNGKVKTLPKLHNLEEESDELTRTLSNNHYKRISAHECDRLASDYFATLISELERVADHLTNIGYSLINPTGDEK